MAAIFLPTPSGWNFHSKLGWFWSLPVDDENIWLFVNGLEWLWLTRTNFPFVYFYKEKKLVLYRCGNVKT